MSTVTLPQAKYRSTVGRHVSHALVVYMLVVVLGAIGWKATGRSVAVTIDGATDSVRTHRTTVGQLLLDLGIILGANDRVAPAPSTPLSQVDSIAVRRARPFQIVTNGKTLEIDSLGQTPLEVLQDANVTVDDYDRVVVNGRMHALNAELTVPGQIEATGSWAPVRPWAKLQHPPMQFNLVRALPVIVDDGGLPYTIRTTAQTVGEALREAEITIYLGDRVVPSLGSEVTTGLRVTMQRSIPVRVMADGRELRTRTRGETVADALAEMHVGLSGLDMVEPSLDAELVEDASIQVTRIAEEVEVVEQIAPFETVFVADAELPIDTQQLVNPGAEGITRSRYRIRYQNGEEVERDLEDTWVAQEPRERVIAYGQQIEPKTFTAADGTTLTYWRHIRMFASSYSASTAGVSPDESYYGRTYTGDVMRHGIVAVDPQIIALRSEVYVPGYGSGRALDTGSAIRARRIDLGFDDDNLELWNRWVDVYLLWPPPPSHQITWVLPNWPPVPQ